MRFHLEHELDTRLKNLENKFERKLRDANRKNASLMLKLEESEKRQKCLEKELSDTQSSFLKDLSSSKIKLANESIDRQNHIIENLEHSINTLDERSMKDRHVLSVMAQYWKQKLSSVSDIEHRQYDQKFSTQLPTSPEVHQVTRVYNNFNNIVLQERRHAAHTFKAPVGGVFHSHGRCYGSGTNSGRHLNI